MTLPGTCSHTEGRPGEVGMASNNSRCPTTGVPGVAQQLYSTPGPKAAATGAWFAATGQMSRVWTMWDGRKLGFTVQAFVTARIFISLALLAEAVQANVD